MVSKSLSGSASRKAPLTAAMLASGADAGGVMGGVGKRGPLEELRHERACERVAGARCVHRFDLWGGNRRGALGIRHDGSARSKR